MGEAASSSLGQPILEGKMLYYIATVDHFDPETGVGFVLHPKGRQGFLHFHRDRGVEMDGGDLIPKFSKRPVARDPKEGDRLVFRVYKNSVGRPFASPWGFEDDWIQARRVELGSSAGAVSVSVSASPY